MGYNYTTMGSLVGKLIPNTLYPLNREVPRDADTFQRVVTQFTDRALTRYGEYEPCEPICAFKEEEYLILGSRLSECDSAVPVIFCRMLYEGQLHAFHVHFQPSYYSLICYNAYVGNIFPYEIEKLDCIDTQYIIRYCDLDKHNTPGELSFQPLGAWKRISHEQLQPITLERLYANITTICATRGKGMAGRSFRYIENRWQ